MIIIIANAYAKSTIGNGEIVSFLSVYSLHSGVSPTFVLTLRARVRRRAQCKYYSPVATIKNIKTILCTVFIGRLRLLRLFAIIRNEMSR